MDDMRRKRKRRTGRPAGGDRVVAAGPLFRRVFATFKDDPDVKLQHETHFLACAQCTHLSIYMVRDAEMPCLV